MKRIAIVITFIIPTYTLPAALAMKQRAEATVVKCGSIKNALILEQRYPSLVTPGASNTKHERSEILHDTIGIMSPAELKELLKKEDPNSGVGTSPTTILMLAAVLQEPETMEHLVKANADVNGKGSTGLTPLIVAVLTSNQKSVKWLLEHNADTTLTDGDGKTPLDRAKETHNEAVIKLRLTKRRIDNQYKHKKKRLQK